MEYEKKERIKIYNLKKKKKEKKIYLDVIKKKVDEYLKYL